MTVTIHLDPVARCHHTGSAAFWQSVGHHIKLWCCQPGRERVLPRLGYINRTGQNSENSIDICPSNTPMKGFNFEHSHKILMIQQGQMCTNTAKWAVYRYTLHLMKVTFNLYISPSAPGPLSLTYALDDSVKWSSCSWSWE